MKHKSENVPGMKNAIVTGATPASRTDVREPHRKTKDWRGAVRESVRLEIKAVAQEAGRTALFWGMGRNRSVEGGAA